MTQEDKDLLLKDLCARLPYGVKVITSVGGEIRNDKEQLNFAQLSLFESGYEDVKPYLFPLSSMTEKQKEELRLEHEKDVKTMANCLKKCSEGDTSLIGKNILYHAVDWCNKNHFDFRNLICRGLAIDCTGLNIY